MEVTHSAAWRGRFAVAVLVTLLALMLAGLVWLSWELAIAYVAVIVAVTTRLRREDRP